jgi:uncharacterized DUF497 family protein
MLFVRLLTWDAWNVAHIARHDVTPEEVEEVCHGEPVTSSAYNGRLRVVGPTQSGRMLTIILAPAHRAGIYYPFTARPADRKERRNYARQRSEDL